MTMFEFMQNAFFMLCGIACFALAFLIIYSTLIGVIRGLRKSKKPPRAQKEQSNGRN